MNHSHSPTLRLSPWLRVFAAAAALIGASANAQMVASNDRVRVVVSIKSANQVKDIKGASADTTTQNKTLAIVITGHPRSSENRVIKWAAYGRDLKSHNLSTLGSGEIKLALVNDRQTVESKTISTTSTPEHYVASKSSGRSSSRSKSKPKKVAAEGIRYVGYSVQVLDGRTVVGEASDPIGIKQEVAK